jgi:hypothetical protein
VCWVNIRKRAGLAVLFWGVSLFFMVTKDEQQPQKWDGHKICKHDIWKGNVLERGGHPWGRTRALRT